jgi:hypothetical protein
LKHVNKDSLVIPFCIACFMTICGPAFLSTRLIFFAPFLALCIYNTTYVRAMWIALGCGLIIDMLTMHTRFGFYALNYTLAIAFLYNRKSFFYPGSFTTLPLLTAFFSVVATCLHLVLSYLLATPQGISWQWVWYDLIVMPFYDAIYAVVCFKIPFMAWGIIFKGKRRPFSPKRPG